MAAGKPDLTADLLDRFVRAVSSSMYSTSPAGPLRWQELGEACAYANILETHVFGGGRDPNADPMEIARQVFCKEYSKPLFIDRLNTRLHAIIQEDEDRMKAAPSIEITPEITKIAERMAQSYLAARTSKGVTNRDLAWQRVWAYGSALCILTGREDDVRDEGGQVSDLISALEADYGSGPLKGGDSLTATVVQYLQEVHETQEVLT